MAAVGGLRRTLLRSSSSSSSSSTKPFHGGINPCSSSSSKGPTFARLPRRRPPLGISRLPVELGCAQSLMPLHSVTALSLLISKLSIKPGSWAWLSEGSFHGLLIKEGVSDGRRHLLDWSWPP